MYLEYLVMNLNSKPPCFRPRGRYFTGDGKAPPYYVEGPMTMTYRVVPINVFLFKLQTIDRMYNIPIMNRTEK